ncbi:zinc metalloprotease HtpX [Microscilla marina]|uniref:Heat shock protein n=1 Tax=Microscilla marina ATCC 23134 TaxID=313606 RepID=A1ZEY9_MICM2|nr:zinc metalloprotease HtpX [Microscilla marina]EAY31091.1 heat shock protein [Microscilla marina ATCC 23134]
MLAEEVIGQHKTRNQLHTLILFVSMLSLIALLGYLLAGQLGVIASVIMGILLMALAPGISPALILRMYKARPIDPYNAPNLHKIVQVLAKRAKLKAVPKLYYVPSTMMNAFAVGTPQSAHIAVTDGLLKTLNLRELAGVLAHEVSHISNNDMRVMSVADMMSRLTGLLSNIGQILLIINLPLLLVGEVGVSWWAILLLIFASPLVGLLQLALSRTREFNADLHAALLTDDPMGLALALKKVAYYSSNLLRQIIVPGYKVREPSIFRSHPNTEERIARLQAMEDKGEPVFQLSEEEASRVLFEKYAHMLASRPRWRPGGFWY